MSKNEIKSLFISGIIFATALAFILRYELIDTAQAIQIIISFVLVLITAIYVKRTAEIAKAAKEQTGASMKMADEMREQRYNAIRPVLDIKKTDTLELSEGSKTTNLGSLMEVREGNIPPFIYCSIYNVGLGTALDTYTEIDFNGEIFPQHYLGTITCGENKNPLPLRVKKEDEHHVLTVTYKDMYGRDIKSSREVSIDKEKGLQLGPLKISLLPQKEE